MKSKTLWFLAAIFPALSAQTSQVGVSGSPTVVEVLAPDIPWNGRFTALATDPLDAQRLLAASESGGLFQSSDGGMSWNHVDGLPPARLFDVKRSPRQHSLLVASAGADGRTSNGGGIWITNDDGQNWTKPPTSNPPRSTFCSSQTTAYGIAFSPDRDDVFVGTDCGLAISRDNGATWIHVLTDSPNQVLAVAAQREGVVNIFTGGNEFSGFRRSIDGGVSFGPIAPGIPPGTDPVVHGLAVSPAEPNVLFLSAYDLGAQSNQLFESDDGGASWMSITDGAVFSGRATRPPFVDVALSADGTPEHIDVYFGNGVNLFRQTCAGPPGVRCGGNFSFVPIAHSDPSEVVFNLMTHCATYLATDGGIHRSSDCGASWPAPLARPPAGLNAVQIYEVASQIHPDHTDLYFGTQDNGFWASGDGGRSWPASTGSEGFLFSLLHQTPTDIGQELTFYDFVSGVLKSTAHFERVQPWTHPPVQFTGIPAIVAPGVFFEFGFSSDQRDQLWLTTDSGATWAPVPGVALPPFQRSGRMFISGTSEAPVIYQPLLGIPLLVKISGARTGMAVVEAADINLSSIGLHCTGICPPVFAVDPLDPMRLIAADDADQVMKVSRDGRSWQRDDLLTSLVTNGQEFLFSTGGFGTQASAIAFHTSRPGEILVGTDGHGIIATSNYGDSWHVVPGSEAIPLVTSFAFDENANAVVVSSYGRGLWRLSNYTDN